ncbi:hypothetical protein [Sphaerisporangium perillae]|uniref:hypothetical protein n=1 Tax=Sphaerisporangium perillae TaxID=2935860 RepID=UPI00200F47AA|nr:hypothetical protein [Sphaerisporangium perillae]
MRLRLRLRLLIGRTPPVRRLYNVIMYAGSVGGLVVLAAWFALWYRLTARAR